MSESESEHGAMAKHLLPASPCGGGKLIGHVSMDRLPFDAHRPSNDGSDVYILEIGRRGRFLLGSAAFFDGIARDEREQWPGGQEPFRLLCHILKIH